MYQYGRRLHRQRNYIILLATVLVVGVVMLLSWLIIHKDLSREGSATSGAPIVTHISEAAAAATFLVDEKNFTFKLPEDWKVIYKPEQNLMRWVWHSTKKGGNDRELTLLMDRDPVVQAVTRMLPLTVSDNKFILGTISDACVGFGGTEAQRKNKGDRWVFVYGFPKNERSKSIRTKPKP